MNIFPISRAGGSGGRSSIQCLLDVGSSKVVCLIARLSPRTDYGLMPSRTHAVEIIGSGMQRSRGIKSGVVVDMDEAEQAIRLAVDQAERSAGMTVDSLTVATTAGRLSSETFKSEISIGGREVEARDVRAVLSVASDHISDSQRTVLHALPIGYSLDDGQAVDDPIGMVGSSLGVDMHVVGADAAPLRNLELCINRLHISVDQMVATPYASGLASLVDDESRMGAACIDMGGGTTSVSIFLGGNLVFADAIAVGGNHVTMDLARCLSIRINDAERLKVLHGAVGADGIDGDDLLTVSSIADAVGQPQQVSVAQLSQIIRPRLEETFELIRDRINRSGFAGALGGRVVLTGGASQLTGIPDLASEILGAQSRIGRPLGISGLNKLSKGPAFAAAAGLAVYPQIEANAFADVLRPANAIRLTGNGAFARFGRWLKESF